MGLIRPTNVIPVLLDDWFLRQTGKHDSGYIKGNTVKNAEMMDIITN